jgi:3-hydroxyacyl-CoA dehydrogenase
VVLTDLDQTRVDRGLALVRHQVDDLAAKNRVSADGAARLRSGITADVGLGAFGDCDLVIEAVFEDLDVKRQALSEVERVVRADCVLATNTSSLSITAMGEALTHPERLVGMHFFNPVAQMPLLEVGRTAVADDAAVATALAVGAALRKTCVLVADGPAFIVNRVLARMLGEINRAVDEGTPPEIADRALDPLGLPMRPYELVRLTGPTVALHVSELMHEAFPDRFAVSPALRGLAERGELPVAAGGSALDESTVRERTLLAVADEIRRMLDSDVVDDVRDVDLALILGAGWPFHLGGIAPYLDRSGIAERATGRRFLPSGVASATPAVPT